MEKMTWERQCWAPVFNKAATPPITDQTEGHFFGLANCDLNFIELLFFLRDFAVVVVIATFV